MEDARWLSCEDPHKLLEWLRGKATDRKLRLFACAFWRLWWDAAAEGQADGDDERNVLLLLNYAENWAENGQRPETTFPSGFGWHPLVAKTAIDAANWTIRQAAGSKSRLDCRRYDRTDRARAAEHQARLLREVFANPFGQAPALDLSWLTPDVVTLAGHIYHDRDFERMPELADALEGAGCADPDILAHCRQQGAVHVRGCWLIDLLLKKT